MSLVSSRVSLIHRCSTLRNEGHDDDWGNPTASWDDHLADQVCRGWTTAGRELTENTTTVVIEDRRLTLPIGTDVTELDLIGDVTYRGDVVLDGPMRIDAIIRYTDRIDLVLTRIS